MNISLKVEVSGNLFKTNVVQSSVIEAAEKSVIPKSLSILRELTPVKTGRAKLGWHSSGKSLINDVEYVEYLDLGTQYIRPRYITAQSVPMIEKQLIAEIESNVRNLA